MKSSLRPLRSVVAPALVFSVLIGPALLALGAAETTRKEKAPAAPAAPKEKAAPKQPAEKSTNVAPKAAPKEPAPIAPKAAPKKGFAGTILEGSNI